MHNVIIDVDGDIKENNKPTAKLEAGEFIEMHEIPIDGLEDTLRKFQKENGYFIDARLWNLAEGMTVARSML